MKKAAYIIFAAALIFSHFTVGITCYSYAHMLCAIAHGGASAPAYIVFVEQIPYFKYNITEVRFAMKNENFDTWLSIGLNILHYRKEQGLTQEQLAEKCGISRTYMQKIETAACSCTLDTLIDISRALGIPLKKLFEFRD